MKTESPKRSKDSFWDSALQAADRAVYSRDRTGSRDSAYALFLSVSARTFSRMPETVCRAYPVSSCPSVSALPHDDRNHRNDQDLHRPVFTSQDENLVLQNDILV